MTIKSLYRDYFQKSRVFLYPALEIKRGVSVTPVQTYVSWEGRYKPEDMKFICLYQLREDEDFQRFERVKLVGNRLFHDFEQVDEDSGIYIFDYSPFEHDWQCFLSGSYSRMTDVHKRKIKDFYGSYSHNFEYIDSFLEPHKYYKIYARLLDVKVDLLKEVRELCSVPELESEQLKIEANHLLKPETL
jgi:hypothetical protein